MNSSFSQAAAELDQDSAGGLIAQVLAMRDFCRAKRIYDDPRIEQADRPDTPMMELVEELDFEDEERIARGDPPEDEED